MSDEIHLFTFFGIDEFRYCYFSKPTKTLEDLKLRLLTFKDTVKEPLIKKEVTFNSAT